MSRMPLALLLPAVCLSLYADSTGRISGRVLTKDGKPIPGAKVNLKRLDRTWTKDIISDKNGSYLQVGLDPVEYDIKVTAEGFQEQAGHIKIPLGEMLPMSFNLLTMDEARAAAAGKGTTPDPGADLDAAGREAFNLAIPLYNDQKYSEALPQFEKSYKSMVDAMAKLKDEEARNALAPELVKVERVYGICMALGGEKKSEAEPFLVKALERNPKDERVIGALIAVAKAKDDKVGEQKFQGMLDQIQGPNPDKIYNQGVESFNAGHTKDAKAFFLKALEVDPKYAEAHFLLAMVAFGENNLKGTKQHLQTYVEMAPTGKNAGTAKEMLKDPSLKNIK